MGIELQLEQLAVDLDLAARIARERMQKSSDGRKNLATFADEVQHRRWLNELLREMTIVVDRTARGNGTASRDRRLYVWPGYDSILLGGSRVTFDLDPEVRRNLSSVGYANGVSEDGQGADHTQRQMQTGMLFPSREKRTDRATLYFDAALAALPQREGDDDNTFSVGGTHNWLALNPTIGGDPLIGFEVRTEGGTREGYRSFPSISLDAARPLQWGEEIAAAIAAVCGDSPHSFWPLPVKRRGESHTDYRDRLESEHQSPRHRSIRHRLYSLWLIGCFAPDPGGLLLSGRGQRWIDSLIAELQDVEPERAERVQGLRALETNIATGADDVSGIMLDARFTTWGVLTIPYPVADTFSGEDGEQSDDLGSGMVLSNFEVPHWYYFMIRQWIASYYLSLRQQESSIVRAQREAHKAALDAERELRRQLSHAVGTELTYVEYLASVAGKSIAEEHFTVDGARLAGGVARARLHGVDAFDDKDFIGTHGVLTVVESALVEIILNTADGDPLLRDVALIEASLAAIPAAEGRRVITALAKEVERATLENRALVRVDDTTVFARFERSREETRDPNAVRLIDLLGRALVVSLTVYFRRAFPEFSEGGEDVCGKSAEALFGRPQDALVARRTIGQSVAHDWRKFVARSYHTEGRAPGYADVRSWLTANLRDRAMLRFDLPTDDYDVRLAPGCGDHAPLVVQAWLTEALMNALKHTRPHSPQADAIIRVDWLAGDVILSISNTTTEERAAEVLASVDASATGLKARKNGHQGLPFLCYAARHLFRGNQLHAHLEQPGPLLHLQVR